MRKEKIEDFHIHLKMPKSVMDKVRQMTEETGATRKYIFVAALKEYFKNHADK